MTESQVCCIHAHYGRTGHSYDCRHHIPRPSRLTRAWRWVRAWWEATC